MGEIGRVGGGNVIFPLLLNSGHLSYYSRLIYVLGVLYILGVLDGLPVEGVLVEGVLVLLGLPVEADLEFVLEEVGDFRAISYVEILSGTEILCGTLFIGLRVRVR